MCNILVFSPHPDDAELIIGGTIAKHSKKYRVIIVDLTKGENSFNSDENKRDIEAVAAGEILNIKGRINLKMKDGLINRNSIEEEKYVIGAIRKFRPSVILAPFKTDKHPDHKEAYYLIKKSVYKAGLNIYPNLGENHNCKNLYYYAQDLNKNNNSFYIDVSQFYNLKFNALNCYKSQFDRNEIYSSTDLNKYMLRKVECKDRYCGSLIESEYAEEIIYEGKLVFENLLELQKYN